MQIKEITSKQEMLNSYDILVEVYPNLTYQAYSTDLDDMLKFNYKQILVLDEKHNIIGLSGFWIGKKLWCGKYLELDNVVVSSKYRSKGAGKLIIEYLERKAKDEKCSMLALDSYTTNFKAHKFFYKHNFEPRGFHFINVLDETKIR